MALIKGKDTKPEVIVRKFLFSKGFRYRKNVKNLPGKPDIVLRKYKTVIFVHGCFWHGHKIDGENWHRRIPETNKDFWISKIKRNEERDRRNKEDLSKEGWATYVIWECDLSSQKKRLNTLSELYSFLENKLIP